MKRLLLLLFILVNSIVVKAQDDLTMNPNNKAYYSRYYDAAPRFPDIYIGGIFQYLSDHVQFPENTHGSVSGQIIIHAIIDTTGAIIDPLIIRSVSPDADRAILDVLSKIPRSQPAMYKGHKVPVFFPIVMNISIDPDSKTIKATRDTPAQLREMQLGRKVYDVKPKFPQQDNNFYKYVAENVKYPADVKADIEGIIQFHFTIDTTGSIKNVMISRTVSKEVDQAIIDAINSAPRFTPATLLGKKVAVRTTFTMDLVVNTTLKTITAKQILPPPPPRTVTGNTPSISDSSPTDPKQIYTAVEVSPGYPGGESAFGKYLQDNIHYPAYAKKNKVQGKVYVQFVIETDGALSDIKVIRTPSVDLGEEAVRVMKMCAKWTPGIQNGKPVRVQYTVPINFSL